MSLEKNIEEISNNFKSLGYEVPEVNVVITDTFFLDGGNIQPPLCQEEDTIYIDPMALSDMKKSNTVNFFLAHEIAHIITNEDHDGENFKEAISKWNSKFPHILGKEVETDNEYIKKYLPTFYKKTQIIDKYENSLSDLPQTQKDAKVNNFVKNKLYLNKLSSFNY